MLRFLNFEFLEQRAPTSLLDWPSRDKNHGLYGHNLELASALSPPRGSWWGLNLEPAVPLPSADYFSTTFFPLTITMPR